MSDKLKDLQRIRQEKGIVASPAHIRFAQDKIETGFTISDPEDVEKATLKHLQGQHNQASHAGGGGAVELTLGEKHAVYEYTGDWHRKNESLRAGEALTGKDKVIGDNLDSAISKSTLGHEMNVYRGMGMEDGSFRDKLKIGTEFLDKGFVSTSSDQEVGQRFTGLTYQTMFKIKLPKGANALDAQPHGGRASEKEMILGRNSKFRVTNIKIIPDTSGAYDFTDFKGILDVWEIDLELIND